jgi:hypothetical protein
MKLSQIKKLKRKLKVLKSRDTDSSINENKLNIIHQIIPPCLEYQKVKCRGEIYSIGDNLIFCEKNGEIKIGQLMRIIPTNGNQKYNYWPMIEIKRYYQILI